MGLSAGVFVFVFVCVCVFVFVCVCVFALPLSLSLSPSISLSLMPSRLLTPPPLTPLLRTYSFKPSTPLPFIPPLMPSRLPAPPPITPRSLPYACRTPYAMEGGGGPGEETKRNRNGEEDTARVGMSADGTRPLSPSLPPSLSLIHTHTHTHTRTHTLTHSLTHSYLRFCVCVVRESKKEKDRENLRERE